MTFETGMTYALKDSSTYDDEYGEGYNYAQAYGDCTGMFITDCWIVNEHGEIHPGLNEQPVPVRFDSLVAESATPTEGEMKVRGTPFAGMFQ